MRWRRLVLLGLLAAWLGVAWHHAGKALPAGTHVASPSCRLPENQAAFIADITAADAWGRPAVSRGIFDGVLALIHGARRFIVLDYGAFGADAAGEARGRGVAAQLTDALLARRREQPALPILFITDPASERYGTVRSSELALLRAAGVEVVTVDLDRLRDSNPAYSSLWRLTLGWWERGAPPPFRTARRLNFKADGRRLMIADDGGGGLAALIGSASLKDTQSGWSNVALRLSGAVLPTLLASELSVAGFSGWRGRADDFTAPPPAAEAAAASACTPGGPAAQATPDLAAVQVLTEGATRDELLARLGQTGQGDAIDVAMYRLADRAVVEGLLAAARRGASVRLLLDPNETGASGGLSGLPNQPVAGELVSRSAGAIHVRWYRTHGEHFHSALVVIYDARRVWLTLGSAQLTRRDLEDYDLEANAAVELSRSAPLAQQALTWFDTLWGNRAALGIEYSADYAAFADPTQANYWLYRFMEGTGFSPF
jgi:hypothetical protein